MKTKQFLQLKLRRKSEADPIGNPSLHLVAWLLDDATPLQEASVHARKRGGVFAATYTGEKGGQVWRSTRTTDHRTALQLARKWEAEARAQRAKLGRIPRKPGTRVAPGTTGSGLSQREVAQILKMSERGVREVERRAFQKLRSHPLLRQLWKDYLAGDLDEDCGELTPVEIAALFDVAQNPAELRLLKKVIMMIQS